MVPTLAGEGAPSIRRQPLRVTIKSLRGLPRARSNEDVYCTCEVPGLPASKFETQARPVSEGWQFEGAVEDCDFGDPLEFAVYSWPCEGGEAELLGRSVLIGERFHGSGFEGELRISGMRCGELFLDIKVTQAKYAPDVEDWKVAHATLSSQQVFRGCSEEFIDELCAKADRLQLGAGQVLDMESSRALYVVEYGAVRLQVGRGPIVVVGPGTVLNWVGFLGLDSRLRQSQRQLSPVGGDDGGNMDRVARKSYTGLGSSGPPVLYQDRQGNGDGVWKELKGTKSNAADELTDEQLCFYSLCPLAAATSADTTSVSGQLELKVTGAGPLEVPLESKQEDDFSSGATIAVVPPVDEEDLRFVDELESFEWKCEELVCIWETLMVSLGDAVLPGAPPEIVWAITEACDRFTVDAGEVIVAEDDVGEPGEAFIIIDKGTATVEKRVALAGGAGHKQELVGYIGALAVVGDICMLTANVPRAATARATTAVTAIRVPLNSFLRVLARFPGLLECCEDRLREAAKFMSDRLFTPMEVCSSLNLFHGCGLDFVCEVAKSAERRVVLGGKALVEQGSASGTLFVLEHGRCDVEVRGVGKVNEVMAGKCFGERTLLGFARSANATVRVSSPMAVALVVPKTVLHSCLEKYEAERARLEELKKQPQATRVVGVPIRSVEIFRKCHNDYLELLGKLIEPRSYMPAQTIFVEGDRESDARMFVLTGGMAVAEKLGQQVSRVSPGATLGELAMLGVIQTRSVTVRAMTFCFALGLRRSTFFSTLEQHPEEEKHFQEILTNQQGDAGVMWPCLQKVSTRLLYLLDIYTEQRTFTRCDKALSAVPLNKAAILVLKGEVGVIGKEGDPVEVLVPGCCFNEQILAGLPSHTGATLRPLSTCEVRVLSQQTWEKVMAEFPEEYESARAAVVRYKVEQSELRLGHTAGGTGVLCAASAVFKASSTAFVASVRAAMEAHLFAPGTLITGDTAKEAEVEGTSATATPEPQMYFLLEGEAYCQDDLGRTLVEPGASLGEASMLGVEQGHQGAWWAGDVACTVQVLRKSALDAVLHKHPEEQQLFEKLREKAPVVSKELVLQQLQRNPPFNRLLPDFVRAVARGFEVVFFAPGATVFTMGETCTQNTCHFYLVLTGKVWLEGRLGTVHSTIMPGEIFGEVEAFGLAGSRTATAHVSQEGVICCFIRFSGAAISAAVDADPDASEPIVQLMVKREQNNTEMEDRRWHWLSDVAVPALRAAPLFAGCSADFLQSLAMGLSESSYQPGATIMEVGEPTGAMLIMLEGSAELYAKTGTKIGRLIAGSAFGEVAALGLFKTCMALVKATEACRVLTVSEAVLQRALAKRGAEATAAHFRDLIERRHEQVTRGTPMTDVNVGAPANDVSVRAVALLSEGIRLEAGATMRLAPDTDTNGPYFGVLAHGRAILEMADNRHPVMALQAGSLILFGLAAEFGAALRADSACEVYRIRRSDFLMAVTSAASGHDWIWRFKLQEKSTQDHLHVRLSSVRGLVEGGAPHSRDAEIQAWTLQKTQRANRARERLGTGIASEAKLPSLVVERPDSGDQALSTGRRTASKAQALGLGGAADAGAAAAEPLCGLGRRSPSKMSSTMSSTAGSDFGLSFSGRRSPSRMASAAGRSPSKLSNVSGDFGLSFGRRSASKVSSLNNSDYGDSWSEAYHGAKWSQAKPTTPLDTERLRKGLHSLQAFFAESSPRAVTPGLRSSGHHGTLQLPKVHGKEGGLAQGRRPSLRSVTSPPHSVLSRSMPDFVGIPHVERGDSEEDLVF